MAQNVVNQRIISYLGKTTAKKESRLIRSAFLLILHYTQGLRLS